MSVTALSDWNGYDSKVGHDHSDNRRRKRNDKVSSVDPLLPIYQPNPHLYLHRRIRVPAALWHCICPWIFDILL